ncbi:hypothetical protein DPMN_117525 [Dreissena polymorpha]|uniref:Uncharacterized protein n=1 Tax=Dreissena polymorpha TaxID=45954 RepID=A0A9D4KQL9_DREPO|nr:hypothetical protein DPMN_117525 [Dreissena polymorpha]
MSLRPKFERLPSGDLQMIRREVPVSTGSLPALCQSPDVVEDQAVAGKYRGQTGLWKRPRILCIYCV